MWSARALPTKPWPLTLGYVTGGPSIIQRTGGANAVATYTGTQGNAPRIEDIGCTAYTLNKNAIWVAAPHALNDSGVTAFATRLYNSTPRGTKIYLQYSNEIFIGNWQYWWMNQISVDREPGRRRPRLISARRSSSMDPRDSRHLRIGLGR